MSSEAQIPLPSHTVPSHPDSEVAGGTENASGVTGVHGTKADLPMHSLSTTNGVAITDGYESCYVDHHRFTLNGSNMGLSKITILRDATFRIRNKLGGSFDTVFDSSRTFEDFLEALTTERLRHMPHKGSKWDNVLRWAEMLAVQVFGVHEAVQGFMLHSYDTAQLIWASCISLLQMGPSQIGVLTKAFSVFRRLGLDLWLLLRHHKLFVRAGEIRRELAYAYSDLMQLTCEVNAHYQSKTRGKSVVDGGDFDEHFGELVASFYYHKDAVTNAMWFASIKRLQNFGDATLDIDTIREFLAPQDRLVRAMARFSIGDSRVEHTCEWFTSHLMNFARKRDDNKVLLITGPPFCGKSVLSDWIIETLQAETENRPYDVISYHVDRRATSTATSLSVIKGLLLQVLDYCVGDEKLFKQLSEAMRLSAKGSSASEVETALWKAFELTLGGNKFMVVIDGLDWMLRSHSDNSNILDRLHSATYQKGPTKAIVLSRPLGKAASQHTQHLSIELEHIRDDMEQFVKTSFTSRSRFRSMNEKDKREIIQKTSEAAKGSFLLAELLCESIADRKTLTEILQYLKDAPKSTEEALDRQIARLDMRQADNKSILSWILAAERPLKLGEIKHLLEIDLAQCMHSPRFTDTEEDVRRACGSLAVVRDGVVYLRHPSMREHIISSATRSSSSDKFVIDFKNAHYELALRSLAYVKAHLHEDVDPLFKRMGPKELNDVFEHFDLLEYCARYWTIHFRSCSLYESSGKHRANSTFEWCLPDSTLLALVEGTCLPSQYALKEAETLQALALTLRKTVLGERSSSVLQSLVMEIQICQALQSSSTSEYSYEAWKLSKAIGHTILAITCAEVFVQSATSITVKKRTEVVTRREEVLKYLIAKHKSIRGVSHALTMRYSKILAELYVQINEIEQAATLYRELYEMSLEIYGHFHSETSSIYDILITQLRALSKFEIIIEIMRAYDEYVVRVLSITDKRRIKSTMALVKIYEEQSLISRAEEVLVSFWRSMTTMDSSDVTIKQTKVDVTIEYSRFLARHSRSAESEVIMRGLWLEVESNREEWYSESSIKHIRMIAEEFKSLKLFSTSRSVLTSVWSYYKKTKQQTTSESLSVATLLAETVIEVTTTTSTTTNTTLTIEEEETLREAFESTISTSSTTISASSLKTCKALCRSYVEQNRQSEALEVYSKVVSQIWSSVESRQAVTEVRGEHRVEVINLTMDYAHSCFKMMQVERAQILYSNIFYGMINGSCDAELLFNTTKTIIQFFETIYRFEEAVSVYQRLYKHLESRLGQTHTLTIQTLYSFGSLATRVGKRTEAEQAYYRIFSSYKMEDGCCHTGAVQAALSLCEIYELNVQWESAQSVFACLWQTFLKYGKEYHLGTDFVERVYQKYIYILEHKTRAEYSLVRQVAAEYRNTCISFYGSHDELTIKATIHLAEISERSETYREESISLYEEVLRESVKISKSTKTTTTTSTQTVARTVKEHLAKLYSSHTSTLTKAESLYEEQFEVYKSQHGYAAKETLTWMRELVLTYKKHDSQEMRAKATSILRTTVNEIFTRETHSETLMESAQTIAKTYVECGYQEIALTIVQELRRRVIEEIKISQEMTSERKSYIFLASFTEVVTGTSSFSAIMAEMRTEILLYQSYFQATKTEGFLYILEQGAHLRMFLQETKQIKEVETIEKELLTLFTKHLSISQTVSDIIIHDFFVICLDKATDVQCDIEVIDTATQDVLRYIDSSRFQEAYHFALLVDGFIHLLGGFRHLQSIRTGFKLSLYLALRGTRRCKDPKLGRALLDLSGTILRQALKDCRTFHMEFTDLDINELNDLVGLLGEQQNYEDLEWILQSLWSSRIVQKTWSSAIVVWIGRRLIETRFSRDHTEEAIHLCRDIRYNLTRVWGRLDKTTLEFTILLSELYTAKGDHRKAMSLHEEVLNELVSSDNEDISKSHGAQIAVTHLELLRASYQRLGGWENKEQEESFRELFYQLAQKFEGEKWWKDKKLAKIEKWSPKGADQTGMWKKPADFSFMVKETKVSRHQHALRRTSSNWAAASNGTS